MSSRIDRGDERGDQLVDQRVTHLVGRLLDGVHLPHALLERIRGRKWRMTSAKQLHA